MYQLYLKFVILHITTYANKAYQICQLQRSNYCKPLNTFTETFAVKLLQIVVSDVSPKKVPAHILLIKLTKIINYSRLNVTKNAHL